LDCRQQLSTQVQQGLLPALGGAGGVDSERGVARPKSQEAYDLYLRSVAVPHDPGAE
jgi:hypothetical protein